MAEGRHFRLLAVAPAALALGLASCATRVIDTAGRPLFRADGYGSSYSSHGGWYAPQQRIAYAQTGFVSVMRAHRKSRFGDWWRHAFRHSPAAPATELVAVTDLRSGLPTPAVVEITSLATGATLRARVETRADLHGRVIAIDEGALRQLGGAPDRLLRVRVRYAAPVLVMRAPRGELHYAWSKPRPSPQPPVLLAQAAPQSVQANAVPAVEHAPAVPAPITPRPAVPMAPSAAAWRVQAGAFASAGNARRAADRLSQLGRASVAPATRADGVTLYRVLVAGMTDEPAARRVQAQVVQAGFADARLIRPL